jgi:hypothetical protein
MPDVHIIAELVKIALAQYLNDSSPDDLNQRRIAATLQALPLCCDMGGCYALRTNGQVVSWLHDIPDSVRLEEDPRIRNIALFQGSKKYPALEILVPARPPEAIECTHCRGTGKIPGPLANKIVCYCGGLGWLLLP